MGPCYRETASAKMNCLPPHLHPAFISDVTRNQVDFHHRAIIVHVHVTAPPKQLCTVTRQCTRFIPGLCHSFHGAIAAASFLCTQSQSQLRFSHTWHCDTQGTLHQALTSNQAPDLFGSSSRLHTSIRHSGHCSSPVVVLLHVNLKGLRRPRRMCQPRLPLRCCESNF